MTDKLFENVGIPEDLLYSGGGCHNFIYQVGEKVEGGFLLHFMLARFLGQYLNEGDNARVLLILNHHSKAHWISIGSKLGVNLSMMEEKGVLTVIDLLKESYVALAGDHDIEGSSAVCLKSLYLRCEKQIHEFIKCNSKRVLVIIESLTNFLDASNSTFHSRERDLIQFLLKLRALSQTQSNVCSITLVSLAQAPESSTESLELTRFAKTVSNSLSSVTFEVSPLSTGFSVQVTGLLKVFSKPRPTNSEKRLESAFIKTFHFKLDSNCVRVTAL